MLSDQKHGGVMSAETLKILSYIGYALSICFLITGIALFFAFGIKNIINELSGRAQKKAVEQIRRKNAEEDKKIPAPFAANARNSSKSDTALLEYGKRICCPGFRQMKLLYWSSYPNTENLSI